MKKNLLIPLLCVLLLTPLCAASAAAGDRDDPLISRSYIDDTFLPQAKAAIAGAAERALAERGAENADGTRVALLAPGEGLRLSAGQRLTVAAGEIKLHTASGEAANVTAGKAAEDGSLPAGTRIIACEDAVLYADAVEEARLVVSAAAEETEDGCPFRDVGRAGWYHDDVAAACRRDLVNGITPEIYEPSGLLTAAQCVKLCACMRQLWETGAVTLENSPDGFWYESYIDYAFEQGLLEADFPDYDAAIDRAEFVTLFYRALPVSAYGEINDVPDGAIPDVDAGDRAADEIYAFYRAGILTGYTDTPGYEEGAFGPEGTITRAEMATIMNRMFDETARVEFSI